MLTKMSEKNICNSRTKQYLLKMAAFKIIKAYLFLILNEYFLLRNGVFCSESSDDSFVYKTLENSNSTEKLKKVSNNNRENLNVIGQIQDDSKEQIEKPEKFQSVDSSSFTAKPEVLQERVDNLYKLLRVFTMSLDRFLCETVSNLRFNLYQMPSQLARLRKNISKEEVKLKTDNLSFNYKKLATEKLCILEKIEHFCELKYLFYRRVSKTLDRKTDDATTLSKKLKSFFDEIRSVKISKSHCETEDLIKRCDVSKIDDEINILINEMNGIKQSLKDHKTQIESMLSVFSKFNDLTLEDIEVVNNLICKLKR